MIRCQSDDNVGDEGEGAEEKVKKANTAHAAILVIALAYDPVKSSCRSWQLRKLYFFFAKTFQLVVEPN